MKHILLAAALCLTPNLVQAEEHNYYETVISAGFRQAGNYAAGILAKDTFATYMAGFEIKMAPLANDVDECVANSVEEIDSGEDWNFVLNQFADLTFTKDEWQEGDIQDVLPEILNEIYCN